MNFYNEHDPRAAAWLRELIRHEHITAGIVDERSIEDIRPNELRGYTQCHFFAGIGGWSLALHLAGWPEDRPVWSGSCPCQPFSSAGKGGGFADERHLWPAFHHLISQCQPPVVFGEQVASKDGLAWLDLVRADCEASGYAVGAVDLCAASVGAPHIRQRLWWVADRIQQGLEGHGWHGDDRDKPGRLGEDSAGSVAQGCAVDGMADANSTGSDPWRATTTPAGHRDPTESTSGLVGMGDSNEPGFQGGAVAKDATTCGSQPTGSLGSPSPLHGFWRDADWLHCRDGKWRPVEPGTFPLAHGLPARVVRLRGYGNAIVPQVAAEFVRAYLEATNR